jgi:hypothetical protein
MKGRSSDGHSDSVSFPVTALSEFLELDEKSRIANATEAK